ncbi:MAG: alpha/beta hydrolase [Gammaproteobacteria bacterium]|nr:alpha/beta hydrolase [Gammaproteobacteria bacterium]
MPSTEHEEMIAMIQAAPPTAGTVEESRAAFDMMMSMFPPADDANIEELMIGQMNADWVNVPESRKDRVVLYLHGGGYVIGSNVGYREFACRVARACEAKVLLINYRLAPENPFPAAVDDATMAYQYLLEQGIAADQIVVAGDSAGGGLTLATLVALRDAGTALPACAICFSPWVDLEGTGDSSKEGAVDDPMVTVDGLLEMGRHYAGHDIRNPLAAPLYADLTGLPALQVFVGTREILRDDSTRIVDNAQSVGVDASLTVGEGLVHVWQVFPGLPESAESLEQMGEFVNKHFG